MLWRPVARDLYFHTDGSFSFFTEFYEVCGAAAAASAAASERLARQDACNDAHSCAIWRSNQLLRNAYGRLAMRACCPSNAHVPHAMSRSMLLQLERRFESEVKATMAHPFRDRDDVNLFQLYPWCVPATCAQRASPLTHTRHLRARGRFLLGERIAHPRRELAASVGVVVSMTRRTQRLGARLNLYLDHDRLESLLRHATFVCFNNGKEDAPELRELLQRRFPQPSPAEVGG